MTFAIGVNFPNTEEPVHAKLLDPPNTFDPGPGFSADEFTWVMPIGVVLMSLPRRPPTTRTMSGSLEPMRSQTTAGTVLKMLPGM